MLPSSFSLFGNWISAEWRSKSVVASGFGGLIIIFATLLPSGCGRPLLFTQPLDENDERYVKVATGVGGGEEWSPRQFAHPLTLTQDEWAEVLRVIIVRPRQSFPPMTATAEKLEPAFTEVEQRYLAEQFARGFAQARSDQMLVFYLARPREPGVTEITSGGSFLETGRLHIVLANYRCAVTMSTLRKVIRDHPLRPVGEVSYEFRPNRFLTVQPIRSRDLSAPLLARTWNVAIDLSVLLGSRDDVGATEGKRGEAAPLIQGPQRSLEERLRVLERLHSLGLITEEEYRTVRQRVLNEL